MEYQNTLLDLIFWTNGNKVVFPFKQVPLSLLKLFLNQARFYVAKMKTGNRKKFETLLRRWIWKMTSWLNQKSTVTTVLSRVCYFWSWITLGQMHGFSGFGHRGYWQVAHKPSFMCHLPVSPEPELEKLCNCPKVIQLQK